MAIYAWLEIAIAAALTKDIQLTVSPIRSFIFICAIWMISMKYTFAIILSFIHQLLKHMSVLSYSYGQNSSMIVMDIPMLKPLLSHTIQKLQKKALDLTKAFY